MISCLWLERPGVWRWIATGAVILVALLPTWPLLWTALHSTERMALGEAFWSATRSSLAIAGLVAAGALLIGMPAGILTALYEFPGRAISLPIIMLPLLVPSFLWAIGWSALASHLGRFATAAISGHAGCVVVFLAGAIPLVLLVSFTAASSLSGSQLDAARLAGGESAVLKNTCRYVAVPACLAAALGGVLTLSDPGPGQIFGQRTVAAEILTSFASQFDFAFAGRQCAMLSCLVFALCIPLAVLAAPRLASQILVRQSRKPHRIKLGYCGGAVAVGFAVLILLVVILPILGLLLPIAHGNGADLARAAREVLRTGLNTILYAVGAGLTAAAGGYLLALCVGRSTLLRTLTLAACFVLLSLPPALLALGTIQLAAAAPPWLDPLLRSRGTVCWLLGLRLFPVAALMAFRDWETFSASWTHAAALHGVPFPTYLCKVLAPHFLRGFGASVLLVALLATADITTVLLLHPPGQGSFPLAIFTVMANAPESLVASLCLIYVVLAGTSLALLWKWIGDSPNDQPAV